MSQTVHAPGRLPVGRRARLAMRRPSPFAFAGALVVVAVAFFVGYPLVSVVVRLFVVDGRLDTSAFGDAAHEPQIGTVLLNTVVVVGISGALAVCAACLFAWLNERTDARVGVFAELLPLAPLLVPPIATAIGWTFLLSPQTGYINVGLRGIFGGTSGPLSIFSWPGLILGYAAYQVPYAYLPVAAALRNVDPALEEASRTSGAGRWRTARNVTIPAVAPAIGSAAVLVLIVGLALFSIPVIIGTGAGHEVLAVRIVRLLTATFPPRTGVAVVLGVLMLIVVTAATLLQARLARARRSAMITGRAGSVPRLRLGAWRVPARLAMCAFLLLGSVLPFLSILLVSLQPFWSPHIALDQLSFDAYRQLFVENALVRDALVRSVQLGLLGATIGVAAAIGLALVARTGSRRAARWIGGLAGIPGSVSHVVIATGIIVAFAGAPFGLANTSAILLIAYVTLYLPQSYFNATAAVNQVGDELLEASRTSGAGFARTLAKVLLPLSARGVAAGWTLAFVLILGDLTASVLLAGTGNAVVGFEILDLYQNGTYPLLAALAVVLSVGASVIVLLVARFTGNLAMARRD